VVDINDFHRSMGHVHEDSLRNMAEYYGLKLRGKFNTCFECSLAKMRQRNVGKTTKKTSKIPCEQLMVDISSVQSPSFGGSKFWIMVLDDCTDMCWSMFVSAKSHLPEQVVLLSKKLQSDKQYPIKHIVKAIQCDNAGENKALEKRRIQEQLGIDFEYTVPETPQFKFATLYGHVRTILNMARLPKDLREGVWAFCRLSGKCDHDDNKTDSSPPLILCYHQSEG
jgi:hypothetical protein